jgi:hypothetical protein
MEVLRVKICHHCGVERADCKRGICPSCRAATQAKEEAQAARREQRRMEKFGPCPHHPHHPATHDGKCLDCHLEVVRARRKQAYRQELAARRQAQEDEEERALADRYAQLDDTGKELFNALARVLWGKVPDYITAVDEEQDSVEEIAHADQQRIDEVAASLLEDIDL